MMFMFLFSFYIFYISIDLFYIKSHFHLFNLLLINYRFFLFFNQYHLELLYYKQFMLIKNDAEILI